MKPFRHYESQFAKAVEQTIVSPDTTTESGEVVDVLRDPGKSKYDKMLAILKYLKVSLFAGKDEGLENWLYAPAEKLPFKIDELEFAGRIGLEGRSSAALYLLESKKPEIKSMVLKVYYGDSAVADDMVELAKEKRAEFEEIQSWYADLREVVLPEEFLIAESPRRRLGLMGSKKEGVVVSVQRFLGTEIRDVFEDINSDELQEMLRQYPRFRKSFQDFADMTVSREAKTGEVPDLVGRRNLIVAMDKGEPHLFLLDHHNKFSTRDGDVRERDILKKNLSILKEQSDRSRSYSLS